MQNVILSTSGTAPAAARQQLAAQQLAAKQMQALTVRTAHFFRSLNGSERGGDLLFMESEPTALRIIIGDIAGDGVHAERHRDDIVWAVRKAYEPVRMVSGVRPSDFMLKFEDVLKSLHLSDEMTLTALAAFIDLENRTLSFARAGHERIIRYNANTREAGVIRNNARGAPMYFGSLSDVRFCDEFPMVNVHLNAGDILLLHTDGLLDQIGKNGRISRAAMETGVKRTVSENASKSAEEIRDAVIAFLVSMNGSHAAITAGDDASFVVVKFE